jgi:predicted phage tail protein
VKKIVLYGHLGKKFGKYHYFDVGSPAEAVRALCANFKDFTQQVLLFNEPGYKVISDKSVTALDQLHGPVKKVIKIVPIVAGAGKTSKALMNIAVGGLLIYLSAGALAPAVAGVGGAAGTAGGSLAGLGAWGIGTLTVQSVEHPSSSIRLPSSHSL